MNSPADSDVPPGSAQNADPAPKQMRSSLVSRNVTIAGHRTSVRLEPEMWSSLSEICRRERMNLHEVCTAVAMRKQGNSSLTAAIRVFVMAYFRAAATEDGHNKAGQGYGASLGVSTTSAPPPARQPAVGMSAFAMPANKMDNGTRRY